MISTKTQRAFTLVEFLVAMTLTLVLLLSSGLAISGAMRSLVDGRVDDAASTLGYSVLERSQAYQCGVDPEPVEFEVCANRLSEEVPDVDVDPPESTPGAGDDTLSYAFYADRDANSCDPDQETISEDDVRNFCYQVLLRSTVEERASVLLVKRTVVVCHPRLLDPSEECDMTLDSPAGVSLSASEVVEVTP